MNKTATFTIQPGSRRGKTGQSLTCNVDLCAKDLVLIAVSCIVGISEEEGLEGALERVERSLVRYRK